MPRPEPTRRSHAALSKQETGRLGEDAAAAWYESNGYSIIARNWRRAEGEIDLIATNGQCVVFCEVKTRKNDRFGIPAEAVTPQKARRIRMLAAHFFAEERGGGSEHGNIPQSIKRMHVRFDVASVMDGMVDVIENAF